MNVALWLRQPGENFSELLRESDSYNRKDLVCFDSMLLLLFFREGVHWRTEKFLFSSCNIWFNFHGLENFFLLLSPHLNHFRPVEANANKFPDIYKSRNRIPSFFYQILSTPNSFWQWTNRDEDDRVATSLSVSDPWERCLDSGLKRKGGSCCCCYQAVSSNPSSTPLASYDPQHVQIRTLRSHFISKDRTRFWFIFLLHFGDLLNKDQMIVSLALLKYMFSFLCDDFLRRRKGFVPDVVRAVPWESEKEKDAVRNKWWLLQRQVIELCL